MKTTVTELRNNLKKYCDRVVTKRKPVRVSRPDGRDVVLMDAVEYDSMSESAHLLSSPENAARLLAALARARKGTTPPMTVGELREALGI